MGDSWRARVEAVAVLSDGRRYIEVARAGDTKRARVEAVAVLPDGRGASSLAIFYP